MKYRICLLLTIFMLSVSFATFEGLSKSKTERELDALLKEYVDATNSHDFSNVLPLLSPDAVYWFNNSSSKGYSEIQKNFESTWSYLPDEVYGIRNVRWLTIEKKNATCIYEYTYEGTHQGKPVKGKGRGTSVFRKVNGKWLIVHEHLSVPVS